MVPEVSSQTSEAEKQRIVLPSYDVRDPQQWPAWCDTPKGALMEHIYSITYRW